MQITAPAFEYIPAAQEVQLASTVVTYLPPGQNEHSDAPLTEYLPVSQTEQSFPPVDAIYFPAGQYEQLTESEAVENLPIGHKVQTNNVL